MNYDTIWTAFSWAFGILLGILAVPYAIFGAILLFIMFIALAGVAFWLFILLVNKVLQIYISIKRKNDAGKKTNSN